MVQGTGCRCWSLQPQSRRAENTVLRRNKMGGQIESMARWGGQRGWWSANNATDVNYESFQQFRPHSRPVGRLKLSKVIRRLA